MNRYSEFFCNMSDEEWEHFAVEVLKHVGFQIQTEPAYGIDGGQDFIVKYGDTNYLVSCKHYIKSQKHVGIYDEENIGDRLLQFNTTDSLTQLDLLDFIPQELLLDYKIV